VLFSIVLASEVFVSNKSLDAKHLYLLSLLLIMVLCTVYIMIINLFKPSQVSTARYLSITVPITRKVSYDHTSIVRDLHCVSRSSRVDGAKPALGTGGGTSNSAGGRAEWSHSF
jgi:hypothetical protein